MNLVVPLVRQGGCDRVYVMPNLVPPITTTEMALEYKKKLEAIEPKVKFLMTLYLSPELIPDEIKKAKEAGILGVKFYPKGVTTNSESGVSEISSYYEAFAAMEEAGLILNIHGECPSCEEDDICVLNAEEKFLPELEVLHKKFPKLKIVLEHVTTKAAVEMVKKLGDAVAATITVHHLELTIDQVVGKNHHFCKPVAKYPHDREALRNVIKEGNPKFFLGSDSAPHPRTNKECASASAGVFTTPDILVYLATIFEKLGALDKLEDFASNFGRKFYSLKQNTRTVRLVKGGEGTAIEKQYSYAKGEIVPFRAGETLPWKIMTN